MSFIWEGRRVVVCVGTGGVGKTTTAAAIALAAASQGLRTLLMTIDPARRLANALGVADLGNVERELPPEHFAPHGVELRAPLWAMMPDSKRIFDDLVERTSPNEETRQRILRSRIYQHFSSALAGAHEYAAVQKLQEVYSAGRYDLIVLDTPPAQNAVDFLDAPSRMLDFLETETLQWLLKPYVLSGKFSVRVLDLGSSFLLRTLGKLAGVETLREIADFLIAFSALYDGFRERSRQVKDLLASDDIAFVLVTGPQPSQQRAMLQFRDELHAEGLRVRCVIANRVRHLAATPELEKRFGEHVRRVLTAHAPDTADRIVDIVRGIGEEIRLAALDCQTIAALGEKLEGTPILTLPELPTDVHDMTGLARLQRAFESRGT
ncbi:MAG: ArsA-related P-loop ATPase [Myxococcota bacterium]